MAKTVSVSVNAVIAAALLLAAGCGFMLYQKHQYDDLMQEFVDLKWQAGGTEANLLLARNALAHCKAAPSNASQE
jgi:outer membrane lipopolysaccharide assembly protein LptE/RlpB